MKRLSGPIFLCALAAVCARAVADNEPADPSAAPAVTYEIELAEWGGIVDDQTAGAILALAGASFPAESETCIFKAGLTELHGICREASDAGRANLGQMQWCNWQIEGSSFWNWLKDFRHGTDYFAWGMSLISERSLGWRYDYISLAMQKLSISVQAHGSPREGMKQWEGTTGFFETLRAGTAVVLMVRPASIRNGWTFIHVWHAEAVRSDLSSEIHRASFDLWFREGVAGIVRMAEFAQAWSAGALPASVSEKWTKKLPYGSLAIVAVARPSRARNVWWNPDGQPVQPDKSWISTADPYDLLVVLANDDPYAPKGSPQPSMVSFPVSRVSDPEKIEIHALLGDGPWSDLGRLERQGDSIEAEETLFLLQEVSPTARKASSPDPLTRVFLKWPYGFDKDVLLVVVDKSGNEYAAHGPNLQISTSPNPPPPPVISQNVPVDIDDIGHFVIRTRPYQRVTFTGFQSDPPVLPVIEEAIPAPQPEVYPRKAVPQLCLVEIEVPLDDKPARSAGQTSIVYQVTEKGMCTSVREVSGEGTQANEMKPLSPEELRVVKQLTGQLPESRSDLPRSRTVIVRLYPRGKEATAVYDQQNLPKRVKALFDILGRRQELDGKL
jgi:hypothetical protein